jgi:hypothetical protein
MKTRPGIVGRVGPDRGKPGHCPAVTVTFLPAARTVTSGVAACPRACGGPPGLGPAGLGNGRPWPLHPRLHGARSRTASKGSRAPRLHVELRADRRTADQTPQASANAHPVPRVATASRLSASCGSPTLSGYKSASYTAL